MLRGKGRSKKALLRHLLSEYNDKILQVKIQVAPQSWGRRF